MFMKKFFILIIVFLSFIYSNIKAQVDTEYNYFSISAGIINSFGSFHQIGETSKFVSAGKDLEELISKNRFHFSYNFSLNGGVYFHHDLKNNNWGFVTGLKYQNFKFNSIYYTALSDIKIIETTKVNSFSLPLYIKYGKKFYEKMNYSFAGAQLNYNYSLKQIFKSEIQISDVKFDKIFFKQFTPGFFIGYNYGFLNLKFEYYPVSFIDIEVIDNAKNILFFSLNINVFPNSRIYRPIPLFGWFKLLFK